MILASMLKSLISLIKSLRNEKTNRKNFKIQFDQNVYMVKGNMKLGVKYIMYAYLHIFNVGHRGGREYLGELLKREFSLNLTILKKMWLSKMFMKCFSAKMSCMEQAISADIPRLVTFQCKLFINYIKECAMFSYQDAFSFR